MRIWIDLDNTPHIPFFIPIVRELESRGHEVSITARDAFQVCELADEMGLPYRRVGSHWGKNAAFKVLGLAVRTAQLVPFCAAYRPDIALSHGSRAQVLLSKMLGIPSIAADDYEASRNIPFGSPKWLLCPEALKQCTFGYGVSPERLRYYRGLKEDVYVPRFVPDPTILGELGLSSGHVIATVRPPADEAHYRNSDSDALFSEFMSIACSKPHVRVVLLPRTEHQKLALRQMHPDWFDGGKTVIPKRAIDGLNLLWHSDFAVSGGGTMNREAAALGVPAYSIFRGTLGAVDLWLEEERRLTIIRSAEEMADKIAFVSRDKTALPNIDSRPALSDILGHVEEIMALEVETGRKRSLRA
jgi:uncharacterized protein